MLYSQLINHGAIFLPDTNYSQKEHDGTKKQSCAWNKPCAGPSLVEVKEW
jgi:hypothetical protein